MIAELAKEYPTDEILNKGNLAIARAAAIELQQKQPARAVDALEPARIFELGSGPIEPVDFWPLYLRGEAYRDLHDSAKALIEYQKIADHRGTRPTSPFYVLARLGSRTGLRGTGRQHQSAGSLPALFCFLEGRRSRDSTLEASQGGVWEARLKSFACSFYQSRGASLQVVKNSVLARQKGRARLSVGPYPIELTRFVSAACLCAL
jgi:hypothetical protein